jgi:hypothetical protein
VLSSVNEFEDADENYNAFLRITPLIANCPDNIILELMLFQGGFYGSRKRFASA